MNLNNQVKDIVYFITIFQFFCVILLIFSLIDDTNRTLVRNNLTINIDTIYVSGLYNTGTNLVKLLLRENCGITVPERPDQEKHKLMKNITQFDFVKDNEIIVVMIKDPLTWVKSMCKSNYDSNIWYNAYCPTNISGSSFRWNHNYPSLIHLWNEWYQNYLFFSRKLKNKIIFVKFEDLLFQQEYTVQKICGKKLKYEILENPAIKKYSSPTYRYEKYTKDDLKFISDNINKELLDTFDYNF